VLYREPAAELPQPEVGFRDYVLASRALETTETYHRSEQYWIDRLDPSLRGPDLPVVQHATGTPTRFARRSARLARSEWQAIRATALRNGLSPTTVALTAFAEVLAFWSRTERFLLNLTLFNRLPLHPDVNRLVGDFTSITVLEVDRRGEESFATAAARIQQRLWDDLDHRFFSGIRVLRELRRRSGAGPVNLAPVVFTSTLGMNGDVQMADAWGQEVFSISQTPQVWLDHKIFEDEGVLGIDWDFAEGLFAEGVIDAMFEAYIRLLKAVANREETWHMDARALRQELFNCRVRAGEVTRFAGAETLHGLFLEQARAQPERIAACARDRRVTFGELDSWSAAYGAELRERGIAPEEPVAVVAPKGWEQAVAVLAVLRAGGTFVPVEPGEPEDRRLRMLQNAGVRFALTTRELATSLAWAEGCRPIPVVPRAAGSVCDSAVDGHRLAYVIYTSGSTGQPKGVMIEHRSVVNTLRDLVERLGLQPTDRVLALSALSFDLSVFDLFGIWCAGGAVVYPDPGRSKDPEHWRELLESEAVTVWNTVPARMEMLVEATRVRNTPLRRVLLSGDWIPVALPHKIRERWPSASQLALGGATEASIWSILHPIERVDPSWTRIPYGRAMKNQSVAVLNETLEQVPTWVVGEIFIGGMGLARGYLNDPSLTRERFIHHPASGDRLYRTGDLGRYLPNGEIEILGRTDQQVKVNGYRVELAEIEAVLQQQAGIERALINLERDVAGRSELVAYLAEQPHSTGLAAASREALAGLSSKLVQRGIRNVEEDATRIELRDHFTPAEGRQAIARQSYRFFADVPASMASVQAWLSAVERRLAGDGLGSVGSRSLEWFERAVCQLKQGRVEGNPFPKYRYPSAGSLYPVQTYFGIPQSSIPGIERGTYYYDPRAHALVRLADSSYPECSPPRMMFVAELNAIEDTYGEASLRFCALEAGYMRGLFLGGLLRPSVPIEEVPLSGSQRVIATFEFDTAPRTCGPTPGPLVFWVGANGLHATEPGFYLRDSTRGLVRRTTNATADPAWFGPNRELFERSHFAVVTVARDSTVGSYMGAGTLGQVMMEEAIRFEIGLCPIGEISDRFLDAAGMSGSIAHGWCSGRIDSAQTRTWMEAPPRLNREALRRRCRERVARHLPAYMHPAKYLFINRLPLTANGKVNRAMLKKVIQPDDSEPRAGMTAEGSDVERTIAQMLEGVLKEPVTDLDCSFFDMGASSMLIVQLHGLVNQRYPDRVTFQDFFDNPSVRGLARCIEGTRTPQAPDVTEVIEL
jgi:amino acid adenylation domain-containing protein